MEYKNQHPNLLGTTGDLQEAINYLPSIEIFKTQLRNANLRFIGINISVSLWAKPTTKHQHTVLKQK
jgi:hypothetical protein